MNIKHPTIVIVNGANWVGSKLVELMIEQNGNVIVVDDFVEANMPFIKRFSQDKHFLFIEKDKLDTLKSSFSEIKYFVHLKHDFGVSDDRISSKTFLSETKFIDEILSIALEKSSVYILTSSIHLHKDFLLKKNHIRQNSKNAYSESDLQDYIEKTVLEYVAKAGLDGRIVRLGNIFGPEMDLSKDELFHQILSDAFYKDEIRVYGDGLEFMYYVYINDAIEGILKALFVERTKGKVYAITNPEEISVLSIVNKILALQPRARGTKFIKEKNFYDPLYEKAYIPDENLAEIGWKPKVSFERGLTLVVDYFKRDLSLKDDNAATSPDFDTLNNTAFSNQENNDSIKFDFDDTINLTNSMLSQNGDKDQFTQFYNKLHDDESPIYNLKRKKELENRSNRTELTLKKRIFKYIFITVTLGLIYIFVIVPVFKFGMFFWHVRNASRELATLTQSPSQIISDYNLYDEISRNISAARWVISLTGGSDLENELLNLSRGLDDSATALQLIQKNSLVKYLTTDEKASDADISKIKDVLIVLDAAKSGLNVGAELNLPFSSTGSIASIRSWIDKTEVSLSLAISSNSNK
jgi:nucleoside-diphosphate-sugar epimerase